MSKLSLWVFGFISGLFIVVACGQEPSPPPTATATPTPTPTTTATPTATTTPTPTPSPTPAPSPTPTPTATTTPTPTPSPTPAPSPTPTPTATATPTATPTPTPSPTPAPSPTPTSAPSGGGVIIECIFYDGLVPSTEADEYVQIANTGDTPVDLEGWRLTDLSDGSPSFTFPTYILEPGERVRVYTNETHPEWGGFSFGRGGAIWNNSDPDVAGLLNALGEEVSRKSYPPGC